MSSYQTEQEEFWASEFGDEYAGRNKGDVLIAGKTFLFSKILSCMQHVNHILELGANIGLNLRAINNLMPEIKLSAVEINPAAVSELEKWGKADVHQGSILDFVAQEAADLVFTGGVLIHINPDMLPKVYDCLYESTNRYICVAEYYNPTPVTVTYRGHDNKLFKRDFAGELLDRYEDLQLVDYGFIYKRDPNFPLDDVTWFVLEKRV